MRRREFLPAALLAPRALPGASLEPSRRWEAWNKARRRFPLAAWSYFSGGSLSATALDYETYAGANLNLVQASLADFEAAARAGLEVVAGPFEKVHLDEAKFRRALDLPIAAYLLKDEPHPADLESLARAHDRIYREEQRGAVVITNLLPNWAVPHSRFKMGYEELVDRCLALSRPCALMHCHYPVMGDGTDRPSYYANLEMFRDKALQHDIGLMGFVLVTSHMGRNNRHIDYRRPSESDLYWQIYSHLAYGAKGLWYYNWRIRSPDYGEALADSETGQPTALYQTVKSANAEVLSLGPTLLTLRSVAVHHTGSTVPEGTRAWRDGAISAMASFRGDDFLLGEFRRGQEVFVLVANKRHGARAGSEELTAEAVFRTGRAVAHVELYDRRTGRPVRLSQRDGLYRISIPGGQGALLRFAAMNR